MFPCLPFAPALSASPNIYRPVLCLLSKHRSQRFLKQQPQLCRRQPQKSHPTSSRYLQSSEKVHLTVFPAFEFFYRCSEVLGTDRLYGEPADDVLSLLLFQIFKLSGLFLYGFFLLSKLFFLLCHDIVPLF